MRTKALVSVLIAGFSCVGFSYDAVGHELVAAIAIKKCSPRTRTKVMAMLSSAQFDIRGRHYDYTDPFVGARFADDVLYVIRKNPYGPHNYSTWHYRDSQYRDLTELLSQWPPADNRHTVVQGIEDAKLALKGVASEGYREGGKQEALLFLLHFVGDVHQPLHCCDDNDNGGHRPMRKVSGGNVVPHTFIDDCADNRVSKNQAAQGAQSAPQRRASIAKLNQEADKLLQEYGSTFTAAQVRDANVMNWVKESYIYGAEQVFPAWQPLSQTTLDNWRGKGCERIVLAGLRLARLLNNLARHW